MNKFYLLLLGLIFSTSLSAEVILSEDFSTWLPDGWSVIEGPGSSSYSHWFHREDNYATVYVTGDNQDEWLISPEFTLPAAGELKLSVDMMGSFYRMVTMDWGDFYVYTSVDDGMNWELLWKEDDQEMVEASAVDWPYNSNEWFYPSISLNDFAGQTLKVAFRYVAPDGDADWWNLDNFEIKSLLEDEVILQAFEYPEYGIINDAFYFEGTFKNLGINDVSSFEAVYTVNGEESDAYVVNNINVPFNSTYDFTHNLSYTYTEAELFDLSLKIVKVNGNDDPLPDNNILFRDISIATGTLIRKPLLEVFTSSTCPSCPSTNEAVDEVLANNPGEYSLVKYQVYWPGAGDPYYIVDDSIRAAYYNVGGVPDLYENGVLNNNGYNYNQAAFNAASEQGAFLSMDLFYSFNGTNVNVDVSLTPTIHITDASVHIAIVEKVTYNNAATNGETEFHNVLMKMLPGPAGSAVSLEPGVTIDISESANLSDTFIEEFDDLEVVVWIQDNETRYVLQSESSDLMVGVHAEKEMDIRLYPSPAQDFLLLEVESASSIKIFSITGALIRELETTGNVTTIDVSDMDQGIYILELINQNSSILRLKFVKE